jgi:hypothetical protein
MCRRHSSLVKGDAACRPIPANQAILMEDINKFHYRVAYAATHLKIKKNAEPVMLP